MSLRLLDLFCCAGGAAMGYYQAGFEVVGVDNRPQLHYPFAFVQADALEYCAAHGREFDAIHASPPCQGYSVGTKWRRNQGTEYPQLITDTQSILSGLGLPYVIENVSGARNILQGPLGLPLFLCGSMFGLGVVRHRWFETNWPYPILSHKCYTSSELDRDLVSMTQHGPPRRWYRRNPGKHFCVKIWHNAMGIDWMNRNELREAIPPAYTFWIGKQLISHMTNLASKPPTG